MKTDRIGRLAAGVCAAGLLVAVQARADTAYDITFNGGGSSASGVLYVDSGVATGGYLDVTAGPEQGAYSLYTWSGGGTSSVRVDGGTDLIVDNLVDVGGNPFLDVDGLAFISSSLNASGQPLEGIDLSLDSGTTYNLGGYGIGGWGNPNVDGLATLVVPEPSALALAGLGASAGLLLVGARRLRAS